MSLKKRGLGRGLEALLAEDSAKDARHQSIKEIHPGETQLAVVAEADKQDVDKQTTMVVAFFKGVQKEHHALLEEAENLRKLIEDFESIIRADLS